METVFSKEIQAGLDAARTESLRHASRLRIDIDGVIHPVLRMGKTGFSISLDNAPHLRGLVDLFDGSKHLFQCLVVASDAGEPGEIHYEFKRATPVTDFAPLDFAKADKSPAALIADGR